VAEARLRDVAREAGVHVATASRALSPATRGRVNAATAARVIAAAERLGYQVNLAARTLRTQRSMMVGVLIPAHGRPLYPPIMQGIVDALETEGYIAVLSGTGEDEERERRLFSALRGRGVDGFILATAHVRHPLLREAAALGIPTVAINRTAEDAPVSSVAADNEAGMADIVTHLAALGHHRIAHVAGPADTSTGLARTRGFLHALERLGLAYLPELAVEASLYSIADGVRAARQLLQRGERFTAIVAGNDLLALGVLDVLRENRVRCPEQVSVTGFNDHAMMDRVAPPLTTVRVPAYQMGVEAARLLLAQLSGSQLEPRHLVLPVELVVRASTAEPGSDRPVVVGRLR
jgi:LacI family transcriptional regulator